MNSLSTMLEFGSMLLAGGVVGSVVGLLLVGVKSWLASRTQVKVLEVENQ